MTNLTENERGSNAECYKVYADDFVRALRNTEGQPLHDYLIEMVTTLSSDRARWMFELKEGHNNPPAPK